MNAATNRKSTQYLVLSALIVIGGTVGAMGNDATEAFLGRSAKEWLVRFESPQPQQRAEAAWAIAQLAIDSPDDPQILLVHGDATVRFWGVQGLQRIVRNARDNDPRRARVSMALRPVLSDSSPAVRIAAAETLALVGDAHESLRVLVESMSHPQEAVRIQAVAALEKLGEAARPAEATLRAATTDPSEYVKRISTRALQKLDAVKK